MYRHSLSTEEMAERLAKYKEKEAERLAKYKEKEAEIKAKYKAIKEGKSSISDNSKLVINVPELKNKRAVSHKPKLRSLSGVFLKTKNKKRIHIMIDQADKKLLKELKNSTGLNSSTIVRVFLRNSDKINYSNPGSNNDSKSKKDKSLYISLDAKDLSSLEDLENSTGLVRSDLVRFMIHNVDKINFSTI